MSDPWRCWPFCAGYYLLAGLAVVVGYHRALSHRSLRAGEGGWNACW